ncbi:MAG: hypothetical protein WCJ18_06265 [Planctomycetota bacterium]
MHPRASLRRITTWLAILGYTLVASGLPLPFGMVAPAASDSPAAKRLAGKDRSRPFPCMDKACGCATAEQCFTDCCCHTPAETLAWARARRIEPAVIAALQRRVAVAPSPAKAACCSSQKSCCSQEPAETSAATGADICSDYQSLAATGPLADQTDEDAEPASRPDRPRAVVLRAMLACGGIASQWFAAAAALPPPVVGSPLLFSLCARISLHDDADECLPASPDAPPPRAI